MKVVLQSFLVAILLGTFPGQSFANDLPPWWPETVCNDLLAPGVSDGLWLTCFAYCEIRDCDSYPPSEQPLRCNRLLNIYDHLADANDPPMPCLEADSGLQVPTCACWPTDLEEPIGLPDALQAEYLPLTGNWGGTCIFDTVSDFYAVGFNDEAGGSATFITAQPGGVCDYFPPAGPSVTVFDLSPEDFDDCKQGIAYLKDEYFPNDCIVIEE